MHTNKIKISVPRNSLTSLTSLTPQKAETGRTWNEANLQSTSQVTFNWCHSSFTKLNMAYHVFFCVGCVHRSLHRFSDVLSLHDKFSCPFLQLNLSTCIMLLLQYAAYLNTTRYCKSIFNHSKCHCTEEGTWIGAETSAFVIKFLASVIRYIKYQYRSS